MNVKQKQKSKMNVVKPYSSKSKKTRKKSPKIIDYDKVAQKYGNLLETSLNTSNSTQPQKALYNNNNLEESYYDYIIDNIYDLNNINDLKEEKPSKIENTKNDDSGYYFTFKQQKPSINNYSNNTSEINMNKNKYKNRAPISIISNKEEMNKYFNDKNNNKNNINNISSIKSYNMYNTFSKQIKTKTKTLKTNSSYKNDNNVDKFKKIDKVINTNYKNSKSYNTIKIKENNNKEINELKNIKEKPKQKKLNRINSQENNFSKKFNLNNNNFNKLVRNSESIQVQGNDCIKEEVINLNKTKKNNLNNNANINFNNNINNKFKEKVMLLLNLCRKYAYKFNKLFPLYESTIPNNSDNNNQSLTELKNTIIQYNNMIFNKNISKIFDLEENKNDLLNMNIFNENETQKLKEKIKDLSEEIKLLKQNEIIYKEKIGNLNQKIEKLNNELNNKENMIKDLKNKTSIKSGKIKEFHGLGENNEDIKINKNQFNEIKESYKKSDISNKNINSYNNNNINNYKREMIQIEEVKKNINNKLNLETNEDKPLNTEIEKLDQEIFNLKSKLKKIIQK